MLMLQESKMQGKESTLSLQETNMLNSLQILEMQWNSNIYSNSVHLL